MFLKGEERVYRSFVISFCPVTALSVSGVYLERRLRRRLYTKMKAIISAIVLSVVLIFCAGNLAAESADKKEQASGSFVFGVVPQFEQRKLYSIWKPIINELERRTGLSFELITTLTVQDFEKEFVKGGFDFVYMNPYYMLRPTNAQGYMPLVRDKAPLRGILVVRKDGPMQKLADLDGKVVAFPSPNAVGASLLVRADLERLYRVIVKPLYVKTHSSVYLHVANGLADAGGGVEKTLQEQDAVVRNSLRVLYTTRDMPSHPVAAHPRVPQGQAEKVRRALLDIGNSREGRELLSKVPVKQICSTSIDDYKIMLEWGLEQYRDPFWKED